jgi:hypothetical protein
MRVDLLLSSRYKTGRKAIADVTSLLNVNFSRQRNLARVATKRTLCHSWLYVCEIDTY